jgi:hypothetical protein
MQVRIIGFVEFLFFTFQDLLMKIMKEDDEFFRFDDECDEFMGLMMNFNIFFTKVNNKNLFDR